MKTNKLLPGVAALAFCIYGAEAAEIDMNTARMQAMDKITGHVKVINVPVSGKINFGSLSIVVRSCKTRPAEEVPENFAFVDIADKSPKGEETNLFKGWMLSSSPATNALENPIYDVWLLQCLNTKIDDSALMSEQELAERDNLPMAPRASLTAAASAKLKTEETPQTTAKDSAEKPMAEMEYLPDEDTENKPENLIEPDNSDNSEFSVDEDDDYDSSAEIQNELNKIKADMQNKELNAEKPAE